MFTKLYFSTYLNFCAKIGILIDFSSQKTFKQIEKINFDQFSGEKFEKF